MNAAEFRDIVAIRIEMGAQNTDEWRYKRIRDALKHAYLGDIVAPFGVVYHIILSYIDDPGIQYDYYEVTGNASRMIREVCEEIGGEGFSRLFSPTPKKDNGVTEKVIINLARGMVKKFIDGENPVLYLEKVARFLAIAALNKGPWKDILDKASVIVGKTVYDAINRTHNVELYRDYIQAIHQFVVTSSDEGGEFRDDLVKHIAEIEDALNKTNLIELAQSKADEQIDKESDEYIDNILSIMSEMLLDSTTALAFAYLFTLWRNFGEIEYAEVVGRVFKRLTGKTILESILQTMEELTS